MAASTKRHPTVGQKKPRPTATERKLKKELQNLSDAVLMYLHYFDILAGLHIKERGPGKQFAKLANALDMVNDGVRHFTLSLPIDAKGKDTAIKKLLIRSKPGVL